MTRLDILAVFLSLAIVPAAAEENSPLLQIVTPDLPKSSRLMGFSFEISAGRVASMRQIPPGWHVTIENDPSWNAKITANAVVGAAALNPGDLTNLFLVQETPVRDKLGSADVVRMSGQIDVMTDGELHGIAERAIGLRAVQRSQ